MLHWYKTALAASLLSAVSAQTCSTLTASGTGAPGTSVTCALDGTANNAFAYLLVGSTTGSTTLNFGPLGTLVLGLAQPFIPVPMGRTDANGDVSLAINVPAAPMQGIDLHAQAVTFAFTMPIPPSTSFLSFCASNVASFHVGS